jgi:hypothetical protein
MPKIKPTTPATAASVEPSNPPQALVMKEADASIVLGVPVSRLRYWRMRGGGPAVVRMGASVRYRLSDLDIFVDANLHPDGTLHVADLMRDADPEDAQ